MTSTPSTGAVAAEAVAMIHDGNIVGLGSGRAALAFVDALGERVRHGLQIRGVPTSEGTAEAARRAAIPLVTIDDVEMIDITVDGADEVDPQLDLIKGWGGALVREKVVAELSRRLVILVGAEKLVTSLGARGKLPVEVVPFAMNVCRQRISGLGLVATPREANGKLFVTDNGNYILDCATTAIGNPAQLEQQLRAIAGVVGTGLFLGMADTVLVQHGDQVEIRRAKVSR
jgi:ribose 5-phosphate isomerase A